MGTNALFHQLYRPPVKLLVLGAGCSGVSQSTAQVSHLWNLVQLSYSSASPMLSKKDIYKRFFRVFPTESSFNPAKFDLLEKFGWKKVGMLFDAHETMFLLTANDFAERAARRGVKILTSESFVNDPRQQVRNLKKENVRIVVGNFYENKARVIFCEAYKEGMFGSKYAWIITGFYSSEWWLEDTRGTADPHDCTEEQMEEVVQGYFTADALPQTNEPGISGKTYDEFHNEYLKRTKSANKTGYQEAPYGYDSVWVVASMLNASIQYMRDRGWNRNIENFTYQDTQMAELFLNFMNSTHLMGVSGLVMFNENGDRMGQTQVEQLQGSVEVQVGVYDPTSTKDNKIEWILDKPIIWMGGNAPPDSITEKFTPRVISVGLFVLMTVLASLGIVLSSFFLAFNIRYRDFKYIKMSSPNMNNFILTGAILAYSSVVFGGIDSVLSSRRVHRVMCKCYVWTLALGFSLAFGAMFSKTWRVHRIFTNKKIQRMIIKDSQLIGIVCVLVSFDLLFLIVWEIVNPLEVVLYNKTTEYMPDPHNDNQVLVPQSRFCESSHMWYFAGGLYGIKGLLLVFGAFLAFETRKVTVPVLNDSKFIGISVYNVVVLCMIGVPTAFMIKEQVDAAYTLISLFTFFATTLTISLIFLPKLLKRNCEPHMGTMWSKAVDSGPVQRKAFDSNSAPVTPTGDKTEAALLRDENAALRNALEECQRILKARDREPFSDMLTPSTQMEDVLLNVDYLHVSATNSLPNLVYHT